MARVEETELSLSTPSELLVRASQSYFLELGLHSGGLCPHYPGLISSPVTWQSSKRLPYKDQRVESKEWTFPRALYMLGK